MNDNELCQGFPFLHSFPILDTAWLFEERHSNRWNFLDGSVVKNLSMQETCVQSLGQEDSLEKKMAIHSSILAWETPWTVEPGGLQSTGITKELDITTKQQFQQV